MTPHQKIVLHELQTARGNGVRGVSITAKTVAALTGLSKDDAETALTGLTESGRATLSVRAGVKRYAAL